MPDTRHKNKNWTIPDNFTWDHVEIAVLMDIRDELQALNRIFGCMNFQRIPRTLAAIKSNTTKKPRKAVAK